MSAFARNLGVSLAVSVFAAGSAFAQSPAWKNTAEIYMMGASMSGTTAVGPVEAQLDVTFKTVLENLQFGAMVNYRGEAPKWAVTADVMFSALGATRDGTHGLQTTKVDADEWLVNLTGSWRASEIFDVFAGVRFTSISDTVVLTPFTGNVRTGKLSKSWFDPIVGARVKAPIGKGWSLEGYGDIGGFSVGSDLTWMLQGRVNWQMSRTVGLGLGYRALYQDYESGSGTDYFKWKITTQGPLLAANLSF